MGARRTRLGSVPGRPRNRAWYRHHERLHWHGFHLPSVLAQYMGCSVDKLGRPVCPTEEHCPYCCYCVDLEGRSASWWQASALR